MSFDRIWVQGNEHPGGWLERRHAERQNRGDEFETVCNRLYAQGDFVVLAAGKNYSLDEIFLSENADDAKEFFETGFRAWESFADDEVEGFGFDEISLYRGGHIVETKSCAPTAPSEANRADSNEWWEQTGKLTCDLVDEEE